MRYQFIVLSILCFILKTTDGRNLDKPEIDSKLDDNSSTKLVNNRFEGHSRHRRQYNNNGINGNFELNNYLRDMSSSFRVIAASLNHLTNYQNDRFNDRRDNNCNCEESINKILAIVEELAIRARNPPPPPSPPTIQVMHFPCQVSPNGEGQQNQNVTIGTRINIDDPNRIWSNYPTEMIPDDEEDDDGSRPVSFKPIPPKRPINEPPPFDHGTNQEGIQTTTPVPVKKPTICEGAILSCCGLKNSERKECFSSYKCLKTYETEKACHPKVIAAVLEKFAKIYGPINDF